MWERGGERKGEGGRQRTFNYFKEYVPSKFSLGGVKLLKCFMSCPAWTATNRLTQIKCCWNFTLCCQQYCCYCCLLLFCSVLFCLNLLSVDIDWNWRRRRRRMRSKKKRSWFYLHSGFFILSYRVARIIVFWGWPIGWLRIPCKWVRRECKRKFNYAAYVYCAYA